jgi:hypothetical protein
VGVHAGGLAAAAAAAQCAGRRGTAVGASYRYSFSSFGVDYAVEGSFEPVDTGLLQLELVTPARRAAGLRDLFTRWLAQVRGTGSHADA